MFSTMMRYEIQKQAGEIPELIAGGLGGAIGGAIPLAALGAGAGALFAPRGQGAMAAKSYGRKGAIIGALLGGIAGAVNTHDSLKDLRESQEGDARAIRIIQEAMSRS